MILYTIAKQEYTQLKKKDDEKIAMVVVQINCDTSADIPIPEPNWDVGSCCFIVDTQDVKFLNSQGEWK